MNPRVLLKGLMLLLSLALFGYFFKSSDLGNSINEAWIDGHIRDQGIEENSPFSRWVPCSAIGLPRQIIAFLAGYAFGLTLGSFSAHLRRCSAVP